MREARRWGPWYGPAIFRRSGRCSRSDAILRFIELRYRLLPHIYSQAGLVHLRGASFIRPVAFAFPDDRRTHDLKSQMLFGEGMMVSPVLEPMYYDVAVSYTHLTLPTICSV